MLSNQLLHTVIREVKKITGGGLSVWTMTGKCLAGLENTNQETEKEVQKALEEILWMKEIQMPDSYCILAENESEPLYVLVFRQVEEEWVHMAAAFVKSQIEILEKTGREQLDQNRFFQNLLLDNILLADIYGQAKRLRIENESPRIAIVVELTDADEQMALELLRGMYGSGKKDAVTTVHEGKIAVIKSIEDGVESESPLQIARTIGDTLEAELMGKARLAYGTIVQELKDVSKSYKEALMALEIGRIFYAQKRVLAYNELGIGRLIYQLPIPLCEMYLDEVFDGQKIDAFDKEVLEAADKFFDNNLNISETARQLYLHRNTLVYRLEKIQKMTGLDVRTFDDALSFKIALMVSEHLRYLRSKEE